MELLLLLLIEQAFLSETDQITIVTQIERANTASNFKICSSKFYWINPQ